MIKSGKRPTIWKQLGAAVCITGMAGAAVTAVSAVSAQAFAQTTENAAPAAASTSERPAPYAMSPESSTLPVNVMRARIPFVSATSSGNAYDIDGKKIDGGLSANIVATGLALEYGINDDISIGLLLPFVVKNGLGIEGNDFKRQRSYQISMRNSMNGAAKLMLNQGLCSSTDACLDLIQNEGFAFPEGTEVTLPTGEKVTTKANVPLKTYFHSLIINAAKPQAGSLGLGDTDLGVKYRWLKGDVMGHAVSLVIHAPTGKYDEVTLSQRATSRGVLEFGARSSFDYKISENYIAGWQHTVDYAVGKGKINRSKLLDNTQLNDNDTTVSNADGFSNDNKFERPGVRNSGFVDVKTSLAQFSPILTTMGGKVRYSYDFDTAVRVEDSEYMSSNGFRGSMERSSIHNLGLGLSFDGFQLEERIPVRISWDLDYPVMGKNKAVAPLRNTVITELYYKF